MKKFPILMTVLSLALVFGACKGKNNNNPDLNGKDDGPKKELTIDEQKEYFSNSVTTVLGYFHPEEQKHAIEVAEFFAKEFSEYEWDLSAMEDFYEERYEVLWEEPKYVTKMISNQALASSNPIYAFSFANDAMIFEASTTTRIVKNKGVSPDGKYTLILRDGQKAYTAVVWGEGLETEYEVDYVDFGWEEHRVVSGKLPEKIHFVFKEDETELISATCELSIVKDDHIKTKVNATVTTLSYTMSESLNASAMSVSYSIKNNKDVLLAMSYDIPSLPILIEKGDLSYEAWIERYGDRWERIVKDADSVVFSVNIGDRVQFRGKAVEGGVLYRELASLFEREDLSEKRMWGNFADIINDHAELAMYFNSSVKQGEVKMDVVRKEDYYVPLPLLYFSDGSSYDLSSYFMEKDVVDEYLDQVDRLLASYERLFKYLDVNFSIY